MQIDDPLENAEDVPGAQSLTRGIDLLLLLGRSSPLTFRQIQDHLGLTKGSLHRLLSALRSRRLVRYDRDTRRYAIGATVMSLARGALDRDATVRACQSEMSRLSHLLKVPCCLYVSDDDSVFVLDAADPAGRTVRVWPRLTIKDSTPGQAMLAGRPAEQKNEYSADLQRTLSKARALGYVASYGDPLAVAASVLDGEGTVVGALCCQFDAAGTQPEKLHDAGQMIREAARRASHHVGVTQRLNEQVIAPRPKTGFKGRVHDTGRDYVGESPSWCAQTGRLWWLDVLAPALRWLDVETGESGRTLLEGLTGGLALTTGPELLLTGENGLSLFDPASGAQTLLIDPEAHRPENRFNTVGVDPEQRMWAGTMPLDNLEKSGTLYRIHPDLTPEIILPEIYLPKNTAFSGDGRRAYLTEQDPVEGRAVLMAYELGEDGLPVSRRVLFEGSDTGGQPAGLTIDAEDCLWVAMRGGWSVIRLDTDGKQIAHHPLPVPMPTALTFGGPDLDSLFVTSTYLRLPPGYNDIAPLSGRLIELKPGVAGRAPVRMNLTT
ncbi:MULTISPECIES: SMP-30/gluconolactonase/LRE family protein [unclassified Marinovum]